MITNNFCQQHIQHIRDNEHNAFRSWNEVMVRGTRAYIEHEDESTIRFLCAAMEIGLIRITCKLNLYFDEFYITQPLKYLVDHFYQRRAFETALGLLDSLSMQIDSLNKVSKMKINRDIHLHYKSLKKIAN